MITPEKFMKTYPQPTRAASSQTTVVEIPPRGNRPARRGSFWPGESFANTTNRWNLTGPFANHAFVLPTLLGNRGPQTL